MAEFGIKKLNHTHQQIMLSLLTDPFAKNLPAIAKKHNYTLPYLRSLMNMPLFKAEFSRLSKEYIKDVRDRIADKAAHVASKSLDRVDDMLSVYNPDGGTDQQRVYLDACDMLLSKVGFDGGKKASNEINTTVLVAPEIMQKAQETIEGRAEIVNE